MTSQTTMILGGVRSGKSRLAERLAIESGLSVTYIATATAQDEEMRVAVILFTLIGVLIFMDRAAFWLLFAMASIAFALRHLILRRIGGATGDTAGALVEITETVILITAVLME